MTFAICVPIIQIAVWRTAHSPACPGGKAGRILDGTHEGVQFFISQIYGANRGDRRPFILEKGDVNELPLEEKLAPPLEMIWRQKTHEELKNFT